MQVSCQEFDEVLGGILESMPASVLLSIPGIYEILSEEFNNEVLDKIKSSREENEDRKSVV